MKTIALPENIYNELIILKLQERSKTAAELIDNLILEYKKKKFLESSLKFREMLKKNKISFGQFLKESRKIREEIADEWF